MSNIKTAKILIIEKSSDEANIWINLLREAGYFVEASFAKTLDVLKEKLIQEEWHLVLLRVSRSVSIVTEEALKVIKLADSYLPCILLYSGSLHGGIVHWMQLGIADAIPVNTPDRLILSAERAMEVVSLKRNVQNSLFVLPNVEDYERMILDNTALGILRIDQGRVVYANKAAVKLFGYTTKKELRAIEVKQLIECEQGADIFAKSIALCEKNYEISDFNDSEIVAKNSAAFHARVVVMPYINALGKAAVQIIIESAGVQVKLRENKIFTEQMSQNASYDLKNMCCNYELNSVQVSKLQSIISTDDTSGQTFFLLIHLKNFEMIVNEENKELASNILAGIEQSIAEIIGIGEIVAISECFCLCSRLHSSSEESACNEISKLSKRFESIIISCQGKVLQPAAAIALVPLNKNTTVTQVLSKGEECLHKAVQKGVNNWHLFEANDDIEERARAGDEFAMVEYAMQKKEIALQFQPIASLSGDSSEYYEVLLRINTPDGNNLSASRFIYAIENSALAIKVDRWVVLQVLKLLVQKKKEKKQINLFVHLSPATFKDAQFFAWVYVAIKKTGIDPSSLIFQFGEECAVSLQQEIERLLSVSHKIGYRVCMCRFGVALESESLVDKFAPDFVKLNAKFTDSLRDENEVTLKRLISMLKSKNCKIIVPNIETAEMLTLVWRLQIDHIQGYFLQRPKYEMGYDFSMEE